MAEKVTVKLGGLQAVIEVEGDQASIILPLPWELKALTPSEKNVKLVFFHDTAEQAK